MNNYFKLILTLTTLTVLVLLSYCSSFKSKIKKEEVTAYDSLWLSFANGIIRRDIKFLVNNSLDTIQCADCNLDDNPNNEYFTSRIFLEKHIDKLMPFDSLKIKDYYIYQDDSLMHVVYNIKKSKSNIRDYDIIYNFIKIGGKYVFQGMIFTP